MKGRIRNNQSAKARSPTRRISSITDFQERLDTVVDVIDDVSDHDPQSGQGLLPRSGEHNFTKLFYGTYKNHRIMFNKVESLKQLEKDNLVAAIKTELLHFRTDR